MASVIYTGEIPAYVGSKKLFEATVTILMGAHICIMGKNGTGKTTLLNKINEIMMANYQSNIVYCRQDIAQVDHADDTVLSFVLKTNLNIYNAHQRIEELECLDRDMTDDELNEYDHLSTLTGMEWDRYEANVYVVLNGLGIINLDRQMKTLSGGWKTRVDLARALVQNPDILLLDEPTNNLDLDATIWLQHYLAEYKKTFICVTHSAEFVDTVATHTWYIGNIDGSGQDLYVCKGRTKEMLRMISDKQKEAEKKYIKFQKDLAAMKVDKKGKKRATEKEIAEFIKNEGVLPPPNPALTRVNFTLNDVSDIGENNIIAFNDVSFHYNDTAQIFNNLNCGIAQHDRIVLVGSNGVGKTTLFKLIAENVIPSSGDVWRDRRIRVGWYNQSIVDLLDLNVTPLVYLHKNKNMPENMCRAHLGRVGFKSIKTENERYDPCNMLINELSGGYKARLAFLMVILEEPSVILLDEPTNHLDIESSDALSDAINTYKGGVVIITHSIDFIKSLDKHSIWQIKDKTIYQHDDIDTYVQEVIKNSAF